MPVVLGFDPATGPTLKTTPCHILTHVGRGINTAHNKQMHQITAKKSLRLDTAGWAKWFTGNGARNWNLTIWTSGEISSIIRLLDLLHLRLVGWLVGYGFNGISTSLGYLIPEPVYTYIIYVICKCQCFGLWWLGFMANWPLKGHWVLNSNMYVYVYINVKAFCLYKLDGRRCC